MEPRIGTLNASEGPYAEGERIAVSPGPGTAGCTYVDQGRFDAWLDAGILDFDSGPKPKAATRKPTRKRKAEPEPEVSDG